MTIIPSTRLFIHLHEIRFAVHETQENRAVSLVDIWLPLNINLMLVPKNLKYLFRTGIKEIYIGIQECEVFSSSTWYCAWNCDVEPKYLGSNSSLGNDSLTGLW